MLTLLCVLCFWPIMITLNLIGHIFSVRHDNAQRRLRNAATPWDAEALRTSILRRCVVSDPGHIEESDARDLVTMHALRWLYGMKDARLREKYIDDWSTRFGSGQHRCAPDDTIAAVLCATQGLSNPRPT